MEERLQKYIASCGVASRRKAEELILNGDIKVNGIVVNTLGIKVNPNKDIVEYKGKVIKPQEKKIYILLNKPINVVTTAKDQFGRETVLDIVNIKERVVPVGRLDMYTSGALILSNDGDFINTIIHPKHEVTKTYNVTVRGIVTGEEVEALREGVIINDNYKTRPAKVRILKIDNEKNISRIEIQIHEGKNRQVRKMCEAIGKKVIALHRSKIGNIDVKDLKIGTWRYLTEKEKDELLKSHL